MINSYDAIIFSPATQMVDPMTGRLTREGYNILQRLASSAGGTNSDLSSLEVSALGKVPHAGSDDQSLPLAPVAHAEAAEPVIPAPVFPYAELVQRIEELEGRLFAAGV